MRARARVRRLMETALKKYDPDAVAEPDARVKASSFEPPADVTIVDVTAKLLSSALSQN